jgi:hypothetical protein
MFNRTMVKIMVKAQFFQWAIRALGRGLSIGILIGANGCGARVEEQPQESNTNWLKACNDQQECGEDMACECGVCTMPCDKLACPSRLKCSDAEECGASSVASCQATCTNDNECERLASGMHCQGGVCVDDSGLTLDQVSGGVSPAVSVEPDPVDNTTCSLAFVEYPVGASVQRNGCSGSNVCTCGSDGEWADCGGDDIVCPWTSEVRPCAETYPNTNLDELNGDPLTVEAASIQGTKLLLSVSHGGGCAPHDYALCFEPGGESYPVGVNLKLFHDANGDTCEGLMHPELQFDLTPIANDYAEDYQSKGDIIQTTWGVFGFGELTCDMRKTAAQIAYGEIDIYAGGECESDDECVDVSNSTGCAVSCGVITSTSKAQNIAEQIAAINENFCAPYNADCGPVIVPPCSPHSAPRCVDGQCAEGDGQ